MWELGRIAAASDAVSTAFDSGPDKVLDYLARYVHRVAITNARILSYDDKTVTFRYKHRKGSEPGEWRTMELPGEKFLQLYLQHVLPRGFHKVRYYGIWHPANRKRLALVRAQLQLAAPALAADAKTVEPAIRRPVVCPCCGSDNVQVIRFLPRPRSPPWVYPRQPTSICA